MLARFGISSRLAYGLLFQSILVICVAIISIWGMFELRMGFTLSYITNILSFLVCIALLVYSFYGFNAKRNQEAFFLSAVILYIVVIIFGIVLIFNMMGGMPWFIALKYIIIPVTIALTYFERVQRGKYDFAV